VTRMVGDHWSSGARSRCLRANERAPPPTRATERECPRHARTIGEMIIMIPRGGHTTVAGSARSQRLTAGSAAVAAPLAGSPWCSSGQQFQVRDLMPCPQFPPPGWGSRERF
jgi:hypothetical protein